MLTRCGGRGSLGGGVAQQRGNLGGAGGQEAEEQPSSTFPLSHQWNQHKCGSVASKCFPVTPMTS